jgi:RNase H-fold protein (predicted Holliday junction resolvase)
VGLPVSTDGQLWRSSTDSQQGRRCRNFAITIAGFLGDKMPVLLVDEAGTTKAAVGILELSKSGRNPSKQKQKKDSLAASLILLSYYEGPGNAVRVKPPRGVLKEKGEEKRQGRLEGQPDGAQDG